MRRVTHQPVVGAILTASACILGALLIMRAGELPMNQAYAGAANAGSTFSVVTATSGVGKETRPQELLYVIDNRNEVLYVFEIDDIAQRKVLLRGGGSLPALFRAGRGR
jgi:hypothetical protein